jgi:hypothetical protein
VTGVFSVLPFAATVIVLPVAHAGHWLADLIILAPVLAVGVWIAIASFRDRRRN